MSKKSKDFPQPESPDGSEGVVLYDEPVKVIQARLEEKVNQARWTGNWTGIPKKLKTSYNSVPAHLQRQFSKFLAGLDQHKAFPYQKFDAALAALRKQVLMTHAMGLGKTRIALMTAALVNKPTVILALPRLVRSVWGRELSALGMDDWAIMERPRAIHPCLKHGVKGDINLLRGVRGIGKLGVKSSDTRDAKVTTEMTHPSRVKVVSYSMLSPVLYKLYPVVCNVCRKTHNKEKCPTITITVFHEKGENVNLKNLCAELEQNLKADKITEEAAEELIKKEFPLVNHVVFVRCNGTLKGALCPECLLPLGHGGGKGKKGHYCRKCGYSARLWQPSIARRLRKFSKMVIIDESQAVKNPDSLRSSAALSFKGSHKILISGTPATTNLLPDLYAQLEWLFGRYGVMFPYTCRPEFQRLNERKSRRDSQEDNKEELTEGMKILHSLLDPVQIRREVDDYGVTTDVELPPVNERRISIPLSAPEQANYDAAASDLRAWVTRNFGTASELDFFTKMWVLRRAASIPQFNNPKVKGNTKIAALVTEVNNYLSQGKKILIGTEMIPMLDAICTAIPSAARIDGKVQVSAADRVVALFQDICPDCNVGLVEDDKGKHKGELVCPLCEKIHKTPQVLAVSRNCVREGVTLNKASVVIVTDPAWCYSDLAQFWKRAHRIGCAYEFLDILYMESAGTIDQQMYDAAEARKIEILQAINRKTVSVITKINIKDFAAELLGVNLSGTVSVDLK